MKTKLSWLVLGGVAGYGILRRRGLRGGATNAEASGPLPGDDVISDPMVQTTHAVSIDAPPSVVWKWLIQAGYRGSGRAGWYGDSRLVKLTEVVFQRFTVPADASTERHHRASANEILPDFQHTAAGDIIPDGPEGTAYFVVEAVDPERAWVLYSNTHPQYMTPTFLHGTSLALHGEFTWVFVLNPIAEAGTRLVLRTRARYGPASLRPLFLPLFYLGEAFIPLQILRGIKERAETIPTPP